MSFLNPRRIGKKKWLPLGYRLKLLGIARRANGGVELRVRCGAFGRGGLTFEYDAFDCCVAHELTHAALAPLIDGSRAALDARPGAPPKACRDSGSWSACFEEHLVRALTLRALLVSGEEKESRGILKRWGRSGYPYLSWFCARLEAYEAGFEDER